MQKFKFNNDFNEIHSHIRTIILTLNSKLKFGWSKGGLNNILINSMLLDFIHFKINQKMILRYMYIISLRGKKSSLTQPHKKKVKNLYTIVFSRRWIRIWGQNNTLSDKFWR